jgi:hypothetical protein
MLFINLQFFSSDLLMIAIINPDRDGMMSLWSWTVKDWLSSIPVLQFFILL